MMHNSLLACCAMLITCGCASVIPQTEPADALYRLGAMAPEYRPGASVSIREPDGSRLMTGRAMVTEDVSGAIRIMKGAEWTDRATSLMQSALLDLLDGQGENADVPAQAGALTEYELSWRIADLSLSGRVARCRLDLTLMAAMGPPSFHQGTVSETAEAEDMSQQARAIALAGAARACVRGAAAFIERETASE